MTEIDSGEPKVTESAIMSLNRSALFWDLREPLYARQLVTLASNYEILLQEANNKFAVVIGEELLPIHFVDIDEAFDFAESNSNDKPTIIHQIKKEGIASNQVYERVVSFERVKNNRQRGSVYKTMGLEQGIVEWREEMEKMSPQDQAEKILNDFPDAKEYIQNQRHLLTGRPTSKQKLVGEDALKNLRKKLKENAERDTLLSPDEGMILG